MIVLTGLDDESKGLEAIQSGAEDYLVKGEVKGRALGRAIRYAVDKVKTREKLVEARQAVFVKRLAGGVAHEFNNLLTQIRVRVDGLMEGRENGDEVYDELQSIATVTSRAANLTRQLLVLGRNNISRSARFDLNEVLEGMRTTLRSLAQPTIDLEFAVCHEACSAVVSLTQFEELLIGLVWAAKAVAPKGGTASFGLKTDTASNLIVLDLVVTGSQLDREKGAKFMRLGMNEPTFDEFFLSLGLPAARRYLDTIDGKLEFIEHAEALAWKVSLPSTSDVVRAPVIPKVEKPRSSLRILVVEDEPVMLSLNKKILKRAGHDVVGAASYEEALGIWNDDKKFDVLFTDIHLGSGPDGVELARRLCEDVPELHCLFCSGYSDRFVEERHGLEVGANFLNKPYSIAQLEQMIAGVELGKVERRRDK